METAREHLEMIARNIAHELQPSVDLKRIAGNNDLIGFHAEAVVKRLIRRTVHPMRVSHGGVIDWPRKPLRQTDVIVWSPHPAPALFEVDDFALVPRSNVFAVLEIKRSAYTDADTLLKSFIDTAPELVGTRKAALNEPPLGLGVVCILEGTPPRLMRELLNSGDVVAIFERDDDENIKTRTDDVLKLVNFLHFATFRYRMSALTGAPQLVTG